MAKPLGPKSRLIRAAIGANPDQGNTELADMLNGAADRKTDKIKVTANDIAQQRQALKSLQAARTTAATAAAKPARTANGNNPDKAKQCFGECPFMAADLPRSNPNLLHHACQG